MLHANSAVAKLVGPSTMTVLVIFEGGIKLGSVDSGLFEAREIRADGKLLTVDLEVVLFVLVLRLRET